MVGVFEIPSNIVAESILPEQFRPSATLQSPEKQLIQAVLEDALEQVRKPVRTVAQRRLRREAAEWMLATDESWVFSFINICAILNLNAGSIRARFTAQLQEALR